MKDHEIVAPTINFDAESTPQQQAVVEMQLRQALQPVSPAPSHSLNILLETACCETGGGQAARQFLFWLAGRRDPTGYEGLGGLEVRRLDKTHKAAALEVLAWRAGPTQSDEPLHAVLSILSDRPGHGSR